MNRVLDILNESSTYPHVSKAALFGIAVINRGADDVVVEVGDESVVTITIKPDETFEDTFHSFKKVDVTAGSSFDLALKG